MELRRLPTLAIEIFKTVNNQNSGFMGEMFYRSLYVSHKKQNLFVQSHKTTTFGDKRLKKTWPSNTEFIPEKIKSVPNLVEVKNSIKIWFDPKCMCNWCSFKNENAENRRWKSFITYSTYKFIFIQLYIYCNNLTVLIMWNWGWEELRRGLGFDLFIWAVLTLIYKVYFILVFILYIFYRE